MWLALHLPWVLAQRWRNGKKLLHFLWLHSLGLKWEWMLRFTVGSGDSPIFFLCRTIFFAAENGFIFKKMSIILGSLHNPNASQRKLFFFKTQDSLAGKLLQVYLVYLTYSGGVSCIYYSTVYQSFASYNKLLTCRTCQRTCRTGRSLRCNVLTFALGCDALEGVAALRWTLKGLEESWCLLIDVLV